MRCTRPPVPGRRGSAANQNPKSDYELFNTAILRLVAARRDLIWRSKSINLRCRKDQSCRKDQRPRTDKWQDPKTNHLFEHQIIILRHFQLHFSCPIYAHLVRQISSMMLEFNGLSSQTERERERTDNVAQREEPPIDYQAKVAAAAPKMIVSRSTHLVTVHRSTSANR